MTDFRSTAMCRAITWGTAAAACFALLGGGCAAKRRGFGPPDSESTGGGAGSSSGGASSESSMGGMGGAGGAAVAPPQDPESCSSDSECLSGECRISYRDRDGDGYGNSDEVTGRCDGMVPAGYSSLGGDCCDDGGNLELAALMHPGQTDYFAEAANICGIAWDYDCSGTIDLSRESTNDGCAVGTAPPDCETATVPLTSSSCGQSVSSTHGCQVIASQVSSWCSSINSYPVSVRCR